MSAVPGAPKHGEGGATVDGRTRSAAANRELWSALVIAWALIFARSFVYLAYEQSLFDSDQAVFGLMAKHLSEGRAFPLFMYGESYMLAVEAWLAVPIFWIAGPTVAALRFSLILTNCGVATLLIAGFWKWCGLRPWYGLVASLFFVFAPPFTSAHLVEAGGGNIEPFLYVLLLWPLRHRPFLFGALLAVGFLNREFTIYSVPVLLAGQLVTRQLFQAAVLRQWLLAFVAFVVVWDGVNALRPYADRNGPGTRGDYVAGFGASQIENLTNRIGQRPGDLPERLRMFLVERLPSLLGAKRVFGGMASQGRDWVAWPLLAGAIAGAVRVAMLARSTTPASAAFIWYILGVGVTASAMFVIARPGSSAPYRYFLLALFVPVGLTAAWLALEPLRRVRIAVVAVMLGWSTLSGIDNVNQTARYVSGDEPNRIRQLADALEARGLRVAEAGYWRAYKLSFLTQERLKIASVDYPRIDEYRRLADREGDRLMRLAEQPCPGGEPVVEHYLCPR
ncbi:MAG TPA: hypothetical protein VES67_18260 [Vicinamibacterales bacterium]|nr:hypothetical protein [Vicinamibacterales bacterium]